MTPDFGDRRALTTTAALVVAVALHLWLLAPWFSSGDQDIDAMYLYQPLAHRLVAKGLGFFLTEPSVEAPPFSYVYPALLGASIPTLRVLNGLLSALALLGAARIAWLGHSRLAGVIAAYLFALSPLLRPFLATAITEPPYILFCCLWMWGLAEWLRGGNAAFLVASALGIAMASLTRAIIFYWIIVLIAGCAWYAWRSRDLALGIRMRQALLAYVCALALPAAFILKNLVLFKFPFFVTGAGNALYLGSNPVTGGYDPGYLGLPFDVGAIARDQSPLTLEAEHLLGGVGRMVIAEMPLLQLAGMYARKLLAFIFVTSIEPSALLMRTWRVWLVVLSVQGIAKLRPAPLRAALAAMLLYQVAVHVPVLYTHRYSVGGLDLWLVIAAGVGCASLVIDFKWARAAWILAAGLAGSVVGAWCYHHLPRPAPEYFRGARLPEWKGPRVSAEFGEQGRSLELPVESGVRFYPWNSHVLVFTTRVGGPPGTQCSPLAIAYKGESDKEFKTVAAEALSVDGKTHQHVISRIPMRLKEPGVLRLSASCRPAAEISFDGVQIFSPVASIDFRERYLHERPLFGTPLER